MESALALIVLITVIFIVIGIAFSGNRRFRRPGDYYNPYYDDYQTPPPVIMVQPAVPMPYGRGRDSFGSIAAILICIFLVYLLGRSSAPDKVNIPEQIYPGENTHTGNLSHTPVQYEYAPVENTPEPQIHTEPLPTSEPVAGEPPQMGSVTSVTAIALRRYTTQEGAEKLIAQYPQRGIEVLKYSENDYLACILFRDNPEAAKKMLTDLLRPKIRKDLARFEAFPELQILQIQSFNPGITL